MRALALTWMRSLKAHRDDGRSLRRAQKRAIGRSGWLRWSEADSHYSPEGEGLRDKALHRGARPVHRCHRFVSRAGTDGWTNADRHERVRARRLERRVHVRRCVQAIASLVLGFGDGLGGSAATQI